MAFAGVGNAGLAKRTGLSYECVYKISSGKVGDPGVKTLFAIADALDVPVQYLMALEESD